MRAWIERIAPLSAFGVVVALAAPAFAGGQGPDLIPAPLPDREIELRILSSVRMVCVDAPAIECENTWLDRGFYGGGPGVANGFRAANCPGNENRCRPDFVAGAELPTTLTIDYTETFFPDEIDPIDVQFDATITLDVNAPAGTEVDNPLFEESYTRFEAYDEEFVLGLFIPPYGFTNGSPPGCAQLEYAALPRDELVKIGQEAFPAQLCQADANGDCQLEPQPLFVETDGTLGFGCNQTVRFALPNRPMDFGERAPVGSFLDVGDVDGDGDEDLLVLEPNDFLSIWVASTRRNDGTNQFGAPISANLILPQFAGERAAFEDFDADGALDIFYTWSDPTSFPPNVWGIARGNGSGSTFGAAPKGFVHGASFHFGNFVPGGSLDVMLNGQVYSGVNLSYSASGTPFAPDVEQVTNFDGDADDDLLSFNASFGVGFLDTWENDGLGSFTGWFPEQPLASYLQFHQALCAVNPYEGLQEDCTLQPRSVRALDVDGDGDDDLVSVMRLRQHAEDGTESYDVDSLWVIWAENNQAFGDFFFSDGAFFQMIGRTASETIEVADVDSDGELDIVSGRLWFRNTGGGFTGPHGILEGPDSESTLTPIRVRDLDDDGNDEILLASTIFDVNAPRACANGLDDDGDGLVDTADPGCVDGSDRNETNASVACDDGIDNDDDGLVDTADLGCASPTGVRENPQCQDGIDNDGGVGTDFDGGVSILGAGNGDPNGADPHCSSFADNREAQTAGASCGLGPELALAIGALAALRRRRR